MDIINLSLQLLNISGIGRMRAKKIIEYYQPGMDLTELIQQLYPSVFVSRSELVKAEYYSRLIRQRSEERDITILSFRDASYSRRLSLSSDYPPLIFVKGRIPLLNHEYAAAIVGSRRSGRDILKLTELLGEILTSRGFSIISGLAVGCDRIAHEIAVKRKSGTIAVMPCGPDIIYPAENVYLAEEILITGGVLFSEYAPGIPPAPFRFVDRDRLQSGLSQLVVLMESTISGGSMYAALSALKENRPLLVFRPEKYTGRFSGNKYLIEVKEVFPFSNPIEFVHNLNMIMTVIKDCNRDSDPLLFPYV